jgi:hypothetical protein
VIIKFGRHRLTLLLDLQGEDVRFAPVEHRRWHDKDYLNKFVFGGLKGVQQCIDKVDNIYGGHVSRLLDICRSAPSHLALQL